MVYRRTVNCTALYESLIVEFILILLFGWPIYMTDIDILIFMSGKISMYRNRMPIMTHKYLFKRAK